ncbi:hypothetical protein T484DRAFT_1815435 [Baffinella frigidus]|nr:hypothetical protein T484DRAFT_1815435 [Cryptophyta sp. CCMP2293]
MYLSAGVLATSWSRGQPTSLALFRPPHGTVIHVSLGGAVIHVSLGGTASSARQAAMTLIV